MHPVIGFVSVLGFGVCVIAVDLGLSCESAVVEPLTQVRAESLLSVQHHRKRQGKHEALSEFTHATGMPQSSLDLLLGGYNIYYGYPIPNAESDRGFFNYAGEPIYEAKYNHSEVLDQSTLLPYGFIKHPVGAAGCSAATNVTSLYRSRELTEMLKAFVVAGDGDAMPGWFRASDDFKTFERMKQNSLRNVIGVSVCSVANLSIGHSKRPPLTAAFLQRARELPSTYEPTGYFNFFDDYGTHVVTWAAMGAIIGVSGFFNESSYNHLNSSDIAWSEMVQGDVLSFDVHGGALNNNTLSSLQRASAFFTSAAQEGKIAFGPAPTGHDRRSWGELVSITPAPIQLQLASICGAFRDVSAQKQANCEMASTAGEYCMRRVMPREGLDPRICLQEPPDPDCLWDVDCGHNSICRNNACLLVGLETDTGLRSSNVFHFKRLFASATLNTMVIVPMIVVAIPLGWAWWQLLSFAHSDEVWTAQDADLREVDISQIGASGVVLLRTPSDRKLAILLSFAGIMLQTMFLYFMSLYSWMNVGGTKVTHDAPCVLLFGSIFMNTVSCCASMITGMKAWHTTAPKGYETIHCILVGLDSFVIPSVSVLVGSVFLCTSSNIASLVLSSTAMAFVCSINSRLAALISWSLSAHGGRIYQPAKLGIKDAVNSMQYTYMSLAFAALFSIIMVPVGIFVFRV